MSSTTRSMRWMVLAGTLLGLGALGRPDARADSTSCQLTLAHEGAKLTQAVLKTLVRCEDQRLSGRLPASTDCSTEPTAVNAIASARAKLAAAVARGCGGSDRQCGTADDDALASIGWNVGTCPGFRGGACKQAIQDCDDVASCMGCVASGAVLEAVDIYYGSFNRNEFGTGSDVNRCQRRIGKAASTHLRVISSRYERCWTDNIVGNGNGFPCFVEIPALSPVQNAEGKFHEAIEQLCCGDDRACDRGEPDPAAIGLPTSCPNVSPEPDGGPVTCANSRTYDTCVPCMNQFAGFCGSDIGVLGQQPYPDECNAVP